MIQNEDNLKTFIDEIVIFIRNVITWHVLPVDHFQKIVNILKYRFNNI